jgi:hypothetical protein
MHGSPKGSMTLKWLPAGCAQGGFGGGDRGLIGSFPERALSNLSSAGRCGSHDVVGGSLSGPMMAHRPRQELNSLMPDRCTDIVRSATHR